MRYNHLLQLLSLSLSLLLGLSSAPLAAQLPQTPSGFTDHPLLERFPDAQIVEAEYRESVVHTLVLGSLQRIREQVVPDAFDRIRGNVTRILYEISQEYSGADVYEFYREQMREKGYVLLFGCEGRVCGSSNYWANDIFHKRILYGPERNQYYVAMRTNSGVKNASSMSLYIITRGNLRSYAYVEIIESGGEIPPTNSVDSKAILSLLQKDGSVVLPGIAFESDDRLDPQSNLDYLVEILQSEPGLQVFLVGHLQGSDPFSSLVQRSLARAGALQQELVERGVAAARIEAQGVGPLAPMCAASDCSARIEMVLR
ncbi:MAG: DUF4892 domain-containing protein [Gammaproteobacteria bacterium]|nr:DUF4892 domain-containing protein [Gammaproteobacteria bacterium]